MFKTPYNLRIIGYLTSNDPIILYQFTNLFKNSFDRGGGGMGARYKVRGTYRIRLKLRHFRRIHPPTPNITEKPGLGTPGYYLYYGLGTLFLRKSEDNVCYFNTANTGHCAEYKTPDFTALCLCVLGIHKVSLDHTTHLFFRWIRRYNF